MENNIIQAAKNLIGEEREHMRRCDEAAAAFREKGDWAKSEAMLRAFEKHFATVVWVMEKLEAAGVEVA